MDLMTILLTWTVHNLAIFIAMLINYVEANPNSMVVPNLTVGDIINVISSLNN